MSNLFSLQAIVAGRVQGVFFRDFTYQIANKLGIVGYVRNLHDGRTVEVLAEGKKPELLVFLEALKNGPPRAKVENMEVTWSDFSGKYSYFFVKY
ncbi:MAG: acylphosphatase [Dehalococcoidia bacterium]|nr:MAG: acylphosphatase [Dehalococcoidia bacterium]